MYNNCIIELLLYDLVKVNNQGEDSLDGINGYMSLTKVSLQDGGYWLWFDLEKD